MKLLNFNPERNLLFNSDRSLQFNLNRKLMFNLDRSLDFDSTRELGFGKRGVIFRGYVCSSCGALVNPMAAECDECGAVFETAQAEKRAKKEPRKTEKPVEKQKFCHYCGYPVTGSDSYCSHCGLRLSVDRGFDNRDTDEYSVEPQYDTVSLPEKKGQKKVVTDWRGTGKEFKDFLKE